MRYDRIVQVFFVTTIFLLVLRHLLQYFFVVSNHFFWLHWRRVRKYGLLGEGFESLMLWVIIHCVSRGCIVIRIHCCRIENFLKVIRIWDFSSHVKCEFVKQALNFLRFFEVFCNRAHLWVFVWRLKLTFTILEFPLPSIVLSRGWSRPSHAATFFRFLFQKG